MVAAAAPAVGTAVANLARNAAGAINRASPSLKQKALTFISQATGGRIKNPADIASFASSGKNALAVVASSAARAGIKPTDIFDVAVLDAAKSSDLDALFQNVTAEFARLYGPIDAAATFLSPSQQQTSQDLLAAEVVTWVRRVFGNVDLVQAHTLLKLFLAMSTEEVQRCVTLRLDRLSS